MCKVSVVLPTYNRAHLIEGAVKSVLEQTFTDFELIVVDDGSTDSTRDVIESIKDKRLRYIRLEKNAGVCNARNVGIDMAQGEWIAFEDSDDIWVKDKLEKQMNLVMQNPEIDIIYCAYKVEERELPIPNADWKGALSGEVYRDLLWRNTIGAPTLIFRKKILAEETRFRTEFKALEDWDFALQICKKHEVLFIQEPLVEVHMQKGGISSSHAYYYDARCRMVSIYYEDMKAYGLLEDIISDILKRAQIDNLVPQVKELIMLYLSARMVN